MLNLRAFCNFIKWEKCVWYIYKCVLYRDSICSAWICGLFSCLSRTWNITCQKQI